MGGHGRKEGGRTVKVHAPQLTPCVSGPSAERSYREQLFFFAFEEVYNSRMFA